MSDTITFHDEERKDCFLVVRGRLVTAHLPRTVSRSQIADLLRELTSMKLARSSLDIAPLREELLMLDPAG